MHMLASHQTKLHSSALPALTAPPLAMLWENRHEYMRFTRLANGAVKQHCCPHLLPRSLSMPIHLYLSRYTTKETCCCPEPSASSNTLLSPGEWLVTEHTPTTGLQEGGISSPLQRATDTQLEAFSLFSSSLAFPEAPGVDLHHKQDLIWTQDPTTQSSDTQKSTWMVLFLPTPRCGFFPLHFLTELSTAFSI